MVPCAPGLPLPGATSGWSGQIQHRSAFAGLSGVTPHPLLVSPLLHHIIRPGLGQRLGGGIVMSVPSPNQHFPETHEEHLLTSHHRLIGHTCRSSTRLHISSVLTDEQRNHSMRQQTNILSVPFQTAARDRPASPRAPHGLTRTWTRLRAPQQARA